MVGHPKVGDAAPDFSLPGWYDGEVRQFTLSAEIGHPVILVFYPQDGGPICVEQLTAYSDELATLTATGARIWGLSPQNLASKAAFAGMHGFKLPLLADAGGEVGEAYGVDDGSGPRRAVFIVDATGTVAWSHISNGNLRYRSPAELAAAVASV